MIPFKVQFDKLTEAYIRGEVKPFDPCACFIGNLLNKTAMWGGLRNFIGKINHRNSSYDVVRFLDACDSVLIEGEGTYTPEEIIELEYIFMAAVNEEYTRMYQKEHGILPPFDEGPSGYVCNNDMYEEALFLAFEKALDKLREIHESKGEKVDDFIFTKRELASQ